MGLGSYGGSHEDGTSGRQWGSDDYMEGATFQDEAAKLNDFASRKSGDYQHLMPQMMDANLLERFKGLGVDDLPAMEEEDRPCDINEEDWEDAVDEGMMRDVLNVEGRNEDEG